MTPEIKQRISQLNNGEVPVGYKKTDLGIFPCEWIQYSIGEVSIDKGKYGINAPACKYKEGLPRYLRITDIDDDGCYIDNSAYVDHANSNEYVLNENDLVFARTGASVGKSYLYKKQDGLLVYAGFLIKFSIDPNKCNAYIVKKNCVSTKFEEWVQIMSARSGQPGINAEEYAEYRFVAPKSSIEQSRIAEILMKWDEAIELHEQYIERLELRKKALMKKILTPKENWEKIKMNQIGKLYQPVTISDAQLKDSGYLVYGANGIIGFYDKYNHEDSEIAITCRGSTCGNVTFTKPYSWITGNAMVFKVFEKYDKKFLYYLCMGRGFKDIVSGSGQPQITRQSFNKIVLTVPNTKSEQNALSTVLTVLDEQTSLHQEKIEKLKLQRKTLQQYLLTGIVRV